MQHTIFLAALCVIPSFAFADNEHNPQYAVGVNLGSGIGLTASRVLPLNILSNDQLQIRGYFGHYSDDAVDDIEISGVEYEADIDVTEYSLGIDWYPFSGKYSDELFFSSGLKYLDFEFDGNSLTSDTQNIGQTSIIGNFERGIRTEIEQSGAAPYISIGYGGRISSNSRWSFNVELGIAYVLNDADVVVTDSSPSDDPLPTDDIRREQEELENEFDGFTGNLNVALTYRF